MRIQWSHTGDDRPRPVGCVISVFRPGTQRAGWTVWAAAALLALANAPAVGQYLETTISVGLDPTYLMWNPASNKVYCADREEGEVYIIDGSTNQVITKLSVSSDPEYMFFVWNSRHNKVYCTTARTDRVWVIDGVTNEVVETVHVGDWPCSMVYSPTSNKVYVRSYDDMRFDVIDGSGDTLLGTVPLGTGAPGWPDVWHSATNRLFATAGYGDSVVVVDCFFDSVVCSIHVAPRPCGVCASAPNGMLYYCCRDGVVVVSAARCSVAATVPDAVGTAVCCYIPYPNKLYAAGGDVYVYAIDCGSSRVVGKLRVGSSGGGILCDTARSKVYSANRIDNHVVVIDARADTILKTITVGRYPCALAWNSTNSRVYVANGDSHSISVIRDTTLAIEESFAGRHVPAWPGIAVLPNPVRERARFRVSLSGPKADRLRILDVTGRICREIAPTEVRDTEILFDWDCRDGRGNPAACGVYAAVLSSSGGSSRVQFVVAGK